MKVYVVMGDAGYGDGQYVAAVFSTAEKAIAAGYGTYDIEECEVDEKEKRDA
ncbi:hypothetical protein ACFWPU_00920 [Streptomyces sp. NPDC058471]|uniref:DUF7336 domain-containing protein n=1 Tax=Streptomyces sp. NPDC058471 TaxID=3346516 RepID=UPI0036561B0D